ncbi:PRMT5 arginine-N-methyltransferase-domain-containing protein [Lineolata rhizophorae]|uniref:Protein arginine N-methyltransferase n=1 Tax=Lineolata rhizophorae TaxID=578093 RepID=A0A6A6PCQ1_9PEZI|nr:PRMT5 arginine-N-methyltransferase-domain-containing protein [Lineolata rhizophorae]
MPTFYIGQHETSRQLPVSEHILRQAQECNYDMLTTPITTAAFHSKVLSLLARHKAQLEAGAAPVNLPAPLVPPLQPDDSLLAPEPHVTQLLACTSPWIDLTSPDPVIASLSRQVFSLEVAYAGFCGISNVIVRGPRLHGRGGGSGQDGVAQYARIIQEALNVSLCLNLQILMPFADPALLDEEIGDLSSFATVPEEEQTTEPRPDPLAQWDAWNVIRTVSRYNARISVALLLPRQLPPTPVQTRWFSEPLRLLIFPGTTFLKNAKGYPVLSKPHQALISKYMRLKQSPWILLSDVGPIPGLEDPEMRVDFASGILSPGAGDSPKVSGPATPTSPTPAEAARLHQSGSSTKKAKDHTPHLSYLRHLQRNQPARSAMERFGGGYQDYLQSPLQPLTDNLESITYEVFEKDPVKYAWYEDAMARALRDWRARGTSTSSPADDAVVIAVVGAGRGPLVTRALRAGESAGVPVRVFAVEKNPNAFVLLQRHNATVWGGRVELVKSDMRSWRGPVLPSSSFRPSISDDPFSDDDPGKQTHTETHGTVDILVSELLGSFADNELSPECLDGVQHVLAPTHGISIPSRYSAHLTPVAAPRLHADLNGRPAGAPASEPDPFETPYVVMLHAADYLATELITDPADPAPGTGVSNNLAVDAAAALPVVHEAWAFTHPLPAAVLEQAATRKGGGVGGGGAGGAMGGDGWNEHNARVARMRFRVGQRGVCHGLAGYFEAVLYDGGDGDGNDSEAGEGDGGKVELSTNPRTMERKSRDMTSWFPIFFPLKEPIYLPDNAELDVCMWRMTDDRKVWYEWLVESFVVLDARRVRLGVSDLHSSKKSGCLM